MRKIKLNTRGWSIRRMPSARARRGVGDPSSLPPEFLTAESEVADEFVAQPTVAARRGAAPRTALDFSYELDPGETAVLALRHPSGALTFHLPVESRRRGATAKEEARFVVDVHSTDPETGRRGVLSAAIKAIVIKVGKVVLDKAVSLLLPKLVAAFERSSWKKRGLVEGWLRVTHDSLAAGRLVPEVPSSTERSLLLIHGTFSHAAGAYRALADSTFFERVAPAYGDRIFAFDHFSLSRTPEENARMLVESLPDKIFTFDVVTHSRGGLVLRNLVERASELGQRAGRFKLGRAVLVASPNEGTPLATPARWRDTVGWLANLLELFPDNPFTTGAEFVAHGIVWLARHASGDIPGLHSMDSGGQLIDELQGPPGPPPEAYAALAANYHPTGDVLRRMLDTGVDQFFGMPNDLVVPTEAGWRVDRSGVTFIPASRIGCFGPGGNIPVNTVTHLDFFSYRETIDVLVAGLSGQPLPLRPVDPSKVLPDHRLVRGFDAAAALPPPAAASPAVASGVAPAAAPAAFEVEGDRVVRSDMFHLVVMKTSESDERHSKILAHYGAARVVEDFRLGGGEAGRRWQTIIAHHEGIKAYIDRNEGEMPTGKTLDEFGAVLFETLFPGAVRRLYDTARSLQRNERLNVILTSMIPWVADKPWEFAYDPVRQSSLATEELHFIRNVMTAVPAERIDDQQRLRILVASAQPIGAGKLSINEEEAVIRRGFEPLREAGLADVEVLARATPASLHGYVQTGHFSVIHFIGHGEYDAKEDRGFLIFQDDQGNPYRVDDQSAREILCGRAIRLVFLNACETGRGGRADFNSGVAPALVAGGVPIVVANQYKVLDTSATFFAQHFYWSLAHGSAIGEAAREARIAVNYSMTGEAMDWAVPVVYAHDPKSRLCPWRPRDPKDTPSPTVRASARRSTAHHLVRIAVWDTNSQFPALRAALERMNAVQKVFGFEIVDLTVPLDAWHMYEGTRYLDADRFAERLEPQIAQLGVQYVSAIVDEWMVHNVKDDPMYNIYGWWPNPGKPPVLIFSTKGLGLEPTGIATDRALANVTVAGIAGYLLGTDSHDRPPRDCPNYFNPKRSLTHLTSRQKFCKPCGSELRRKHQAEAKALNAILAAFS